MSKPNVTRVQSVTQSTASVYTWHTSVADSLNIQHEWVNHSKGQFTKTVARVAPGKPRVVAHTGTIDSCWNQLKRFLPSALHSRHAMLFTYCKAWQWRFVHRNENVANITAQTLRKLTWCQKAPCGESSCPKQIWKSKKTIFCPQLDWDLQKIIVLPQRNLRFVLPQPWIFVTDFEGVFRMKMCSRWGKTLIFVIPTVTALMDHAILQVRHWKTQHFYAYHTIEDVPKTLKRCPGFRALRMFLHSGFPYVGQKCTIYLVWCMNFGSLETRFLSCLESWIFGAQDPV